MAVEANRAVLIIAIVVGVAVGVTQGQQSATNSASHDWLCYLGSLLYLFFDTPFLLARPSLHFVCEKHCSRLFPLLSAICCCVSFVMFVALAHARVARLLVLLD